MQRHGISRLPEVEGDKAAKKKFKSYAIGFFHVDIAEVRTKEGKLHLFVGIDRTSEFAFVQLHEQADLRTAIAFLEALIAATPYRLHRFSPTTGSNSQTCLEPRRLDGALSGAPLRSDLPRARHRTSADQAKPSLD